MVIKIRSKEELISSLAENSKKRKQELITLKELIKSQRKHEQAIFCRLSVVMAYAHWQGFVLYSSSAYLEYLNHRSLKFEELTINLQALAYKDKIRSYGSPPKEISHYLEIIGLTEKIIELDVNKVIDFKSNLDYDNFENICRSVGIDCQNYWSTYKPFIDELVKNRCSIAHGGLDIQDYDYADEVLTKVIKFIDNYKTDIENLAVTDACFCSSDAEK
jgi:hypothetical protein